MRWMLGAAGLIVALAQAWGHATAARQLAAARAIVDDGVLRTVILGDSVARGAGDELGLGIAGFLDRQLHALGTHAARVVNLGLDGARTRDVRALLTKGRARDGVMNADVVVLSIGGNDLYGDSLARMLSGIAPARQQRRTLARVERVVRTIRRVNPATRIYILGLYNPYRRSQRGEWLDQQVDLWDARLIARFASTRELTVVRICDLLVRDDRISTIDRFHPGAKGYEAIAQRIASSYDSSGQRRPDSR